MSVRFAINEKVLFRGKPHTILAEPQNLEFVMLKDSETSKPVRAAFHEVSAAPTEQSHLAKVRELPLDALTPKQQEQAERRYQVIKDLLNVIVDRESIEKASVQNDVGVSTIYRWINRYKVFGNISALVDQEGKGGKGKSRINEKVSGVIAAQIGKTTLNGLSFRALYVEIQKICRQRKYAIPSKNTVRRFIHAVDERERVKRIKGPRTAAEKYDPVPGTMHEEVAPLHWVEIDHTIADIMLVDDETGEVIGRPWVTVVLDIYSRAVLGFFASFQAPGCFGTGVALVNAMLPKDRLLIEYGLDPKLWPCWGKMKLVRCDNAREFKSDMLKVACKHYDINFEFRAVAKPRHGAFIERWMGTFALRLKDVRGATSVSREMRKNFKPEKEACLTLSQFQEWLTLMIIHYNNEVHSSIGMTPVEKWQHGLFNEVNGIGFPPRMEDTRQLRLDFAPTVMRTIRPNGVRINHMFYYDLPFVSFIGLDKRKKYVFKRDPRDVSKIYFLDPVEKQYHEIPFSYHSAPKCISLWEIDGIVKQLKADGKVPDPKSISELYERRKSLEENAQKQTKTNLKRKAMNSTLAKEKADAKSAASEKPEKTKLMIINRDEEITPFEVYVKRSFK